MIVRTVWPGYVPGAPVLTNGPEVKNPLVTAPTDFVTAGKKPLEFQRETVGKPFPLGLDGNRRR